MHYSLMAKRKWRGIFTYFLRSELKLKCWLDIVHLVEEKKERFLTKLHSYSSIHIFNFQQIAVQLLESCQSPLTVDCNWELSQRGLTQLLMSLFFFHPLRAINGFVDSNVWCFLSVWGFRSSWIYKQLSFIKKNTKAEVPAEPLGVKTHNLRRERLVLFQLLFEGHSYKLKNVNEPKIWLQVRMILNLWDSIKLK